jgi:hypothetical protein
MELCRWNIAPHDIQTKLTQLQKFLDKGIQVAVCVAYETRRGKWREQYPKAVEVCQVHAVRCENLRCVTLSSRVHDCYLRLSSVTLSCIACSMMGNCKIKHVKHFRVPATVPRHTPNAALQAKVEL